MEMRISFEGVVCHIVSRQYEQCCGAVTFFGQLRLRFFKIHSNRTLVLNFFSFKSFHKEKVQARAAPDPQHCVYCIRCMQDKKKYELKEIMYIYG